MAFTKKTTVPRYDAPKKEAETEEDPGLTDLRNAAISAVENQHGPFVRRSKNYEAMVEDAMRQISTAIAVNK
jgi:hypothetical protein